MNILEQGWSAVARLNAVDNSRLVMVVNWHGGIIPYPYVASAELGGSQLKY